MGNNPSRSNRGDNYPVENVTWKICHEFVERLTAMMHEAGMPQEWEFRMPTEAQWEFAAKGGNKSKGYTYAGSNTLSEVGWNLNDGRNDRTSWVSTICRAMCMNGLRTISHLIPPSRRPIRATLPVSILRGRSSNAAARSGTTMLIVTPALIAMPTMRT